MSQKAGTDPCAMARLTFMFRLRNKFADHCLDDANVAVEEAT